MPKVTVSSKPTAWERLKKRPDPLTSIALTIPVFLVYHLGILVVTRRNQVDLVSDTAFRLLNSSKPAYIIGTLSLALLLAVFVMIEEKRGAASGVKLNRVLLEGLVFALIVLAGMGWGASRLLRLADPGTAALGPIDKLVLACGTGFHEELVFRAFLVTGFSAVLTKLFRLSAKAGLIAAVTVSSLAFAIVHHYGPLGEPFVADVFFYRVVLGGLFAGLYLLRGFAVAVYAHVFFELLVYFLYA